MAAIVVTRATCFWLMLWVLSACVPKQDAVYLFEGDTCLPPCWFGLTAGISRSEDAANLLLNHELIELPIGQDFITGVVDGDTLINGSYHFSFVNAERPQYALIFSEIVIRESLVYRIESDVVEDIRLGTALEMLGMPDQIRLVIDRGPQIFTTGFASFQIEFIYVDKLLRLAFLTDPEPSSLIFCDKATILDNFWLATAIYFSPESALDTELSSPNNPQASLTYYSTPNSRHLPPEQWEAWMNTEEILPCEGVWESLSDEEIYPDLSSLELP